MIDRFDELLRPTEHTPASKRVAVRGQKDRQNYTNPAKPSSPQPSGCAASWTTFRGPPVCTRPGLDALNEGKGVCQDFVHLSLIVLRSMGIPARYVSGYLHPKPKAVVGDTVDGRSHAWIQAWTGGWWSYDPTNDTEITEQYVSVGVGRDYTDVAPLKGIYSGEGATDLDVIVEITRLA